MIICGDVPMPGLHMTCRKSPFWGFRGRGEFPSRAVLVKRSKRKLCVKAGIHIQA